MKRKHKEDKYKTAKNNETNDGSVLLVLIVSSFALIVVLALTTLSSLNINVVRSCVEYTQGLLTAQAAVSQFLYEQDLYQSQNSEIDISSLSKPLNLKVRYQEFPVFNNTRSEFPGEVSITFDDTKQYHSTDNSLSERPAKGWKDKGMSTLSVPPFTIDLILNVKIGSSEKHFEALINRIWNYAAFCEKGGITITNPKNLKSNGGAYLPSQIKGNLFSSLFIFLGLPQSQDEGNTVIGDLYTSARKSSNNNVNNDPIYVHKGNTIQGDKRYCILSPAGIRKSTYFESIKFPDKNQFKELKPKEFPQLQNYDSGVEATLSLEEGSFTWVGSMEKIEKYNQLIISYTSIALNNIESLPNDVKSFVNDYIKVNKPANIYLSNNQLIKNAINQYVKENLYGHSLFLKENLILEGTECSNKFFLRGNLSNHYVKYLRSSQIAKTNNNSSISNNNCKPSGDEIIWECDEEIFSKAGLILKNCTLFVDGDVELLECNSNGMQIESSKSPGLSIEGYNATLIVSGNLKIMGGQLDSKDKGMVVLAKNIELSTRGDFRGMILSKGTILINLYNGVSFTSEGCRLNILGAIACGGTYATIEDGESSATDSSLSGLVLKGINLTFDSRYTKTLQQFGKLTVVMWQEFH